MNETLLYIILGVLYLVFTLLGRAAKKKQQEQKKQEPWSLEDVLGDFPSSSQEQPHSSAPPPTPKPEPIPVPFNWSDEFRPSGSMESQIYPPLHPKLQDCPRSGKRIRPRLKQYIRTYQDGVGQLHQRRAPFRGSSRIHHRRRQQFCLVKYSPNLRSPQTLCKASPVRALSSDTIAGPVTRQIGGFW